VVGDADTVGAFDTVRVTGTVVAFPLAGESVMVPL
jgi:hypothetical protein